ncbi:MAG: cytochrome-c peroxidase [Alphaproteobacteria bacterium]|nr:cytochrome-c peroxidase [Alphaproteobacteria bacterium]
MKPLMLIAMLAACGGADTTTPEPTPEPPAKSDAKALIESANKVFAPLPSVAESETNPITDAKVELGRMLYYENRMSKAQEISCNSCHMLDRYGVDNEPTSPGHKGQRGGRNSPTTYNAAFHLAQFWDGRAADVEAQAKGPVLNPIEMAMPSEDVVIATLKSIPGYADKFAAAFPDNPDPINYDNVALAIGAFERQLVTPSPFDAFLGGKEDALTAEQQAGLKTFMDTGCVSCHSGALLGGQSYMKLGMVRPYETADVGRAEITGNDADKFFFKVPSLRNIEKTGPYFHDGSVATLPEAIRLMGAHQLGQDLSDEKVASIEAFLKSLTGELPKDYIAKPELPASGPKTPKPDPS